MASDWLHGKPIPLERAYASFRPSSSYTQTTSVLKLLIGANALVFGAWVISDQQRNSRALRTLTDNFTLSLRNLKEHRYYTAITSALSHRDVGHFVFNMFNFWTFGQIIAHAGVGATNLTAVCLISGVAGSSAWAYHHAFMRRDGRPQWARDQDTALGASGMVMGAGAVAACLRPFIPMNLMFIPVPIPLWVLVGAYFAIDAFYLNGGGRIGHSAHLGGAVAGAAYYLLGLRGFGGILSSVGRRMR